MKHFFLILISAFTANATLIGDFAPVKVGSTWKYSYNTSELSEQGKRTNQLTIEINLVSAKLSGNDTLILFNVKEQGRSTSTSASNDTIFDTTGTAIFVDTVLISNTIIQRAPKYKCEVFPFWETHYVDSTILINHYLFKSVTNQYPGTVVTQLDQYDRNIGLKSSVFTYDGAIGKSSRTINLISYNENVSVKRENQSYHTPERFSISKSKILTLTNSIMPQSAFSITGRRIGTGDRSPAGIIISNGYENNKKNR